MTRLLECVAALAAATLAVAGLEHVAPVEGLAVIYLLAVLFVAIRHGEVAALTTAVASVLAFNFFFIEPRHRLTIADQRNVVALGVLLVAAAVVGRLAAAARQRARESEERAQLAAAREREALVLAEVASSLLGDERLEPRLAKAGLRLQLSPVPKEQDGELSAPLRLSDRTAWLYLRPDAGWKASDLDRIAEPLARLVDVALERERMLERAADAEAARRADTAKTAVLHAISHDLRSPLTAILTATQALRTGSVSEADRNELVAVLGEESSRLDRLVADLLDLSRIQADAVNPQRDWCDLHDIVGRAAGERPVSIQLPDELPLVRADSTQLERVFANLIENAVKFSPPGEQVRVTGGSGGGRVTVRVVDRGRGIPAAQRPHVFEPFFRGRGDRAGSGLGLAICRGFVEANGGSISLSSRKDEGTAFAVSFPLEPQPSPVP